MEIDDVEIEFQVLIILDVLGGLVDRFFFFFVNYLEIWYDHRFPWMEIGSTFSNSNIDSTLAWESSQFIVSNFNEVFGKHKLKEHVWNNKACPKLQFRNCARKRNYFVKEKFNSLARNKIYFSLSKKETIPRTCSWLKIIFQTVEKLILENFLDKTRHSRREKYVFFPTRTNYPKIHQHR